jgi:hypothetical protein
MGLPKVSKHKARKDLYKIGFKFSAENKQGYKTDRTRPSTETEDEIIVKGGQEYFAWKRKGQPYSYSITYPQFPILKSEWEENTERFQESISNAEELDEDEKQELVTEIEEYRDELQSRLDNMPYQLQESSVLNERIEELDNMLSELE